MDFDIHGVLLLVWLCNGLSTSFVLNAVVQHHTQELRCGDHVCHHRQRCLIEMRNVTYLRLRCHHQSHDDIPCSPNSLRSNHRCSCDTRTCVDHTLISLVSAVTTPTIATNQNGLLCGDHVCKGHQFCIIEETQDSKLHPRCADVHNTHHCLPNLLSLGSSCFCDTRTCVDHTLISIVAGHQVAALICSDQDDHSCHADQVCRLHNTNGHLNGQCINIHNEPYKQADRDGCPHILGEGHECFCNNNDCVQQTQAATGHHTVTTTNHNDLVCGDHVCHGHQYCIIEEKRDGELHLKCADVNNTQHCLPNLLSLGSSCFCDTRTCVDHTLISIVAGHQVAGLICSDHDDHSCHADLVCEISIYRNGIIKHCGKGDHMTPCTQLPINSHEKCYCTTQSCVFGQFSAPTTMSTTSKLTTTGPTIASSTTISQTTVQPTVKSTTVQPTVKSTTVQPTVKSTTVQPTVKSTTVQPTVKSTTVQPTVKSTIVQPITAQPTTVQQTTAQPSTSVATTGISTITVALTNTSMVQVASSIPTTTVVTAVTSSTNNTCTDDEDSNFSCVVYEMMYGLCAATTGTLFNIAQKRCQAFCGICAGNNTSGTPPAALPTQPTCIDHDARCSQFQFHICSSSVSQNFVISTCPKSCNKCAEYLASLNPQPVTTTAQPVTTTAQPVINTAQPVTTKAQQVTTTANPITTTPKPVTKTAAPTTTAQSVTTATGTRTCHICGEMTFQIPCSSRQIGRDLPQTCKTGEDYCMTDIVQDAQGNVDVFKRCVDLATCENKWNTESAGLKYCQQYGVVPNPDAYSCHFCCTQDKCNSMLVPNATTWYTKTN